MTLAGHPILSRSATGASPSLFIYDTLGRVIRAGLDATGNGTLDLASADRALWLTRNLGSRARASACPSTRS